ncbi:MAG: cysteine desulfurase family protein [Flavobacterium sp.]|uniref:cysteine desulfurase family protein n=1 Tax=Flavobacterium sp. TaxID=239 RepID=UPI003262DE52
MISKPHIYFDNASTTRVDEGVIRVMNSYHTELYGNASSSHKFGMQINAAVEDAKSKVAQLINAKAKEVVFTSGATESINTVLKGIVNANHLKNRNKIITVSTEHTAVLDTCHFLEEQGIDVIYLPVQKNGLIDLEILKRNINEQTLIVCVMFVNNETGVIQPINDIAKIAHEAGAMMFTDATQAVGKIDVNVVDLDIDFMAFSAHKYHGPKGIGGFFVKEKFIKILIPFIHGGSHQNGLRSGTLNVPGIIGFGEASSIAIEQEENIKRITSLRDLLEHELLKVEGSFVNGDLSNRVYNISNITFSDIDADVVIRLLDNICVSNGSACSSALIEPSYVLKAMGLNDSEAFSSLRFSLSKYNTTEEVFYAANKLKEIITQLTPKKYV